MSEISEIWWRQITGARKFLDRTAKALAGGKSAVICLTEPTPWLGDMHRILREFLNKKFGGTKAVHEIDAASVEVEPAVFVFENFCSDNVKFEFIPFGEKARVKFLAERDDIALNNICLWIHDISEAQTESWLAFIADYNNFLRGRSKGIFLLETRANLGLTDKAEVEVFSCANEVSDYDCFAFNILIAAEFGKGDKFTKRYLAELVSNTTELDVERGAELIKCGGDFLKNPRKFLKNKSREEITQAIWRTQLKLIFPQIEIFRRDFIKNHEALIKTFLPFEMDTGKKIFMPDEAELGELCYMLGGESWKLSREEWDELRIYLNARNKLAHLSTLTLEEVQQIFNGG